MRLGKIRFIAAVLILLSAGSRAAPVPGAASADEGLPMSIESSTQGNYKELGIGVGYVGGGSYLDENGSRRDGPHAGLSISVEGEPKLFSQPDVRAGQILTVGEYRILIEAIDPSGKGTVVLRLWVPPKPAKRAWSWRGLFGF